MDYNQAALEMHSEHHGKIAICGKVSVKDRDDLATAYTPGVAEPCRRIAANPDDVWTYTAKSNLIAVVSDGSAVLGLGNIGPEAAMPVMEGKALLFHDFGGVDAVPICLDAQTPEQIIAAVRAIAPTFGGINLEDISAPRCFEVEQTLERELDIPVFHDDQHGTAIVVSAALTNALRLTGRDIADARIVLNGPGAAGTAITKMLLSLGARDIVVCDRTGIIHQGRENLAPHKAELARLTNPRGLTGTLADAVPGSDVFIGVSTAGVLTKDMVRSMSERPIVFAMANPTPEIPYADAVEAGAYVVGTGRSDFPNQINNVLAFPGIFRGALDCRARDINTEMKHAAVFALADLVGDDLSPEYVLPDPFDPRVARAIAEAVAKAARETGVARA
ncbi:MAG: malic enzyme-like NAD(P)-binding protein [Coriobacteriales bacterium]|jgi:malate dehydrogenase (oxaloacetate-decarboxylating)